MVAKSIALGTVFLIAGVAMGQTLPANNQEVQVGQSIADIFRSASGADVALVASGFLSPTRDPKNLADTFQFPSDELWLVSLTGKQLNEAFDRSLSFYPEPCTDMLYFSGAEVTFQSGRTVKTKVVSVTVGGAPLDLGKTYKVAMPASLARGGLSYFSLWNFQKPEKVISPAISKLLDGKSVQTSTLRWLLRQSL
jgi:2',3'-cyclic-nucleotide 2'-phosphodiesterase (5'-nucleotidase family)